jgi:hypothetical protein
MNVPEVRNLEKWGAPNGLTIIMTSSAYMTDEAWKSLALPLAQGI